MAGVVSALASLAGVLGAAANGTAAGRAQTRAAMAAAAIALQAMPSASAGFFRKRDGDVAVQLSVVGVTPGSRHSVQVELESCRARFRPGGDQVSPVVVRADSAGQIHATIDTGRPAARLARQRLFLTLRQGVARRGASPLTVSGLACTRVPRRVSPRLRWLPLGPVTVSGRQLRGTATYSYNPDDPTSRTGLSVTVAIHASGLVPGTMHAADVDSGSCEDQGAVLLMLPDLRANSRGDVSVSDRIPVTRPPNGPLYINIHEGNNRTILSAGKPTLAFRPLLCADLSRPAPTQPSPVPTGIPGTWKLIFDDEFNGTALDTSEWSTGWFGTGVTGPVNSYEEACYSPSQVSVSGGSLNLTAISQPTSCNGSQHPYLSGIITTDGRFQFTYGAIQARIWMPGSGTTISDWPAFWTDGQVYPDDGEIDVVEGLHGMACYFFHPGTFGGCSPSSSAGPGWHTYAADWEPGSITYYHDGKRMGEVTTGVTSSPMYVILDLALSSMLSPPDQTPETMRVDYVRVWQH